MAPSPEDQINPEIEKASEELAQFLYEVYRKKKAREEQGNL